MTAAVIHVNIFIYMSNQSSGSTTTLLITALAKCFLYDYQSPLHVYGRRRTPVLFNIASVYVGC